MNTVIANELRHNYLAFVNGEQHKAYAGKNEMYVYFQLAPGYGTWIEKSKLERDGCTVIVRSGRC